MLSLSLELKTLDLKSTTTTEPLLMRQPVFWGYSIVPVQLNRLARILKVCSYCAIKRANAVCVEPQACSACLCCPHTTKIGFLSKWFIRFSSRESLS